MSVKRLLDKGFTGCRMKSASCKGLREYSEDL